MGLPLKSLQALACPPILRLSPISGWPGRRSCHCSTAPRHCAPRHLRDPVGPQIQFASESFIDEIAAAVGDDPVAFRRAI